MESNPASWKCDESNTEASDTRLSSSVCAQFILFPSLTDGKSGIHATVVGSVLAKQTLHLEFGDL